MEAGEQQTRIMVAVNQSSTKGYRQPSISSRTAFEWILQKIVQSNVQDFKLLFVHVQYSDEEAFKDVEKVYALPTDFSGMIQRGRIRGIHLLQYFVKHCHQIGLNCEAWIRTGEPTEAICREVKRVQPDLLVLGNRGLKPFERIFRGSVSEFCVKHAECPVITIKRKPEEIPQDPVDD